MASVQLHEGEHFESLFKRFRKSVQNEKILKELRRRRYFEKPSQTRKRAAIKKRIKSRRTTLKDLQRRY